MTYSWKRLVQLLPPSIIHLDAFCFFNHNYESQELPPLLKQSIFFLEKENCELAFFLLWLDY